MYDLAPLLMGDMSVLTMGIDPWTSQDDPARRIEASHRWMNDPCRRALPPSERLRRLPLSIALSRDNPVSDALLCRAITAGEIEGRIVVNSREKANSSVRACAKLGTRMVARKDLMRVQITGSGTRTHA